MNAVYPVLLLVCSNVFMTFAWYGHLKFKDSALWLVVLVSWGIAFFEYCLQVPANRMGHEIFPPPVKRHAGSHYAGSICRVFRYLSGGKIRWNHIAGFALLIVAAALIFKK